MRSVEFFMVTPFRLDQLFADKRRVVEEVAQAHALTCHYAAFQVPMLFGGFHLEQTMAALRRAAFVVADLSYERPNCYYEVGYAHGLGKEVHLIAYEPRAAEHLPLSEVLGIEHVRYYTDLASYRRLIEAILSRHAVVLPADETLAELDIGGTARDRVSVPRTPRRQMPRS